MNNYEENNTTFIELSDDENVSGSKIIGYISVYAFPFKHIFLTTTFLERSYLVKTNYLFFFIIRLRNRKNKLSLVFSRNTGVQHKCSGHPASVYSDDLLMANTYIII